MITTQRTRRLDIQAPADRGHHAAVAGRAVKRLSVPALAIALSFVLSAALSGCGGGESNSKLDIGVNPNSDSRQFAQDKITITDNPLDLAIRGTGFFQIANDNSPPMYTRNGQFRLDADGYIVDNEQMRLMGHQANAAGVIQGGGRPEALKLRTTGVPPQVTDNITIMGNLDSRVAATGRAAAPGIDFNNPSTYNGGCSLTVYDVRGQDVSLTLYFQKSDIAGATPGSIIWNVFATANGLPVGGEPAAPVATLVYPADGSAPIPPSGKLTVAEIVAGTYANGATIVPLTNVTLDLEGTTQYGAAFGVTDIRQSGSPAGHLTSIGFEANGVLMGRYSNGRKVPSGQIELATFANPLCLQLVGNSDWIASPACGEPLVGAPGSGNFGVLLGGALEGP